MKIGTIDIASRALQGGASTAGGIATYLVNNKIVPMVLKDKADPKIANLIAFGIGFMVPALSGGKGKKADAMKSEFLRAFGDGMMTIAGVNLVNAFAPPEALKKLGIAGPLGIGNVFEKERITGVAEKTFSESIGAYDRYNTDVPVNGYSAVS